MADDAGNTLLLKRLGIDTHEEPVVYMRADCHVSKSEGFSAQSRVKVTTASASIIATLNVLRDGFVSPHEAGLSEAAWRLLGATPGEVATLSHPRPVESLGAVRAKVFGHAFGEPQMTAILQDMAAGRYTDIELSAYLTACAAVGMSLDEVVWQTRGMVDVGTRLGWDRPIVADKHCVGGLPGNRTTPIVVSIVAAAGVWIPKTSSRAITSPAGTADAMETLAPVDLDLTAMRRVVEREGGCVIWGGAIHLSPVDDLLVRVERALDVDSDSQLVSSVLSKKVAAGATHVVIDLPVGPTAKIRTSQAAYAVARLLERVGDAVGLMVRPVLTDGTQPVGRGIGPALEARDVVAVTRGDRDAAQDLRARAVLLAGEVLELLLGAAQFGHFAGGRDAHAVVGQPVRRPLDVDAVAVLVDIAVAVVALALAGHDLPGGVDGGRAVIGMDQVERAQAERLGGGVAEDALEAGADEQETALGVDHAHRVGQQVEHFGEGRQLGDHGMAGVVAPGRGAVQVWAEYGSARGTKGVGGHASPAPQKADKGLRLSRPRVVRQPGSSVRAGYRAAPAAT